jgi:hypothetical protein
MYQLVVPDVLEDKFFEVTDSDDEIVIFNFKSFVLEDMNDPKFHNG